MLVYAIATDHFLCVQINWEFLCEFARYLPTSQLQTVGRLHYKSWVGLGHTPLTRYIYVHMTYLHSWAKALLHVVFRLLDSTQCVMYCQWSLKLTPSANVVVHIQIVWYTCCIIQSHTYLLTTHSLPSAVRTGRYLIIEPINVEAQTNYRHNSSVFAYRSRCGCDLQNMGLHAILMNSSHVVCDCSQLARNLITLRYVHIPWAYKY